MEQTLFDRIAPTQYGIKHEPLMVTAIGSNKRNGQIVAFIGKQLCFFEHDGYIPTIGEKVEVMITRAIYPKYTESDVTEATLRGDKYIPYEGAFNRGRLVAALIRPVEPDKHQLMAITGFECSGSMCRTTSSAMVTDGSKPFLISDLRRDKNFSHRSISLTPGRCGIRESMNVNSGRTWEIPYQPLIPTNVYVDKAVMEERKTLFYIAGMTRVEDSEYSHLFKV